MRSATFTLIAFALLFTANAFAWGNEGHRITGYVANELLTANTRESLKALLGTDDLATIASWMDDEREMLDREMPGSSRWHYENRPACANASTKSPCPRGDCITHQIERLRAQLSNPQLNHEQRARAVRILVHLIGDLHQPLHLADNHDRGGNEVYVFVGKDREASRLHAIWDTRFVRMNLRRKPEPVFARELMPRYLVNISAWQQGTLEHWANESYQVGKQSAYLALPNFACGTHSPHPITLANDYIDNARQIVSEQLAKAGVRIAVVLNQSLH